MWTHEALKVRMYVVERGTCSLKRAIRSWNIPLNLLFDHMNGKTRFLEDGAKSCAYK
jgi:hypothetical protein